MYAHKDKKEKAAGIDIISLISPYVNTRTLLNNSILHEEPAETAKNAADKLVKVDMPHSDKPTYAGQEREEGEIKTENKEEPQNSGIERRDPENAINSLLQKISVVLSQPMAQMLENRKAQQEGRNPAYQPKNPGISRYSAPTPSIPMPMGMQQPAPQAQPAQPQAQPAQPQQQRGAGMNSPSANPINSFGPISSSGNINGNAAFGIKNSPDSLKTADLRDQAIKTMQDTIRRLPTLGYNGEPGFASTFKNKALQQAMWDYGALAPIGLAGAGLAYASMPKAKPPVVVPPQEPEQTPPVKKKLLDQEQVKAADFQTFINNARYHLPKIRPIDTAAGMAVGGLAGAVRDWATPAQVDEYGRKKKKGWGNVLGGAMIGAGLSNLAGDRLRRYVSNKVPPMGYGAEMTNYLKPGWRNPEQMPNGKDMRNAGQKWQDAWHDIRDGLIYDKNVYPVGPHSSMGSHGATSLAARQELVRRSFGLPLNMTGADPIWQKNKGGYYSLNEKSPQYASRLRDVYGPVHDAMVKKQPLSFRRGGLYDYFNQKNPVTYDSFLTNPETAIKRLNAPQFDEYGMADTRNFDMLAYGNLMGDQQIPYMPRAGGGVTGRTLDRWDLTPNKDEYGHVGDFAKNMLNPKWYSSPLKKNLSAYIRPETHTNSDALKTILARMGWDNVLADELPWVSQGFEVAPTPNGSSPYGLRFTQEDGTPATPTMDTAKLQSWIERRNQ